ncbi:MAG: tol-pal system protein YbgF [Burkholderiales bacterium]|nr:tol-pal system protein YbgF [Burkholderiales bacterium]
MPRTAAATCPIVRNSARLTGAALASLAAVALLSAAPAQAQLFRDDELHNRVRQLESQRAADARRIESVEGRAGALEPRADTQARQVLDLNAQIEALKQDIARLRGQIEVLVNDLENATRRQRDFYVDLDGRVRKLETPPPAPAVEAPKGPGPDEQRAYENGLNLVKAANYKGAVEAFGAFLKAHPRSTLAPSAQYWIGNSLFALRDYKAAIAAQQQVVDTWPDDPKAPDAMLNIASAQTDLKDLRGARATMEALIKRYPQSDAAATARTRLPRLR